MIGLKGTVIKNRETGLNLISEKYSRVFVTGIPFLPEEELEENNENLPVLVFKVDPSWHVEPAEPPIEGNFGWFSNGNYVDIGEVYGWPVIVPIFDRQETPEEHELLTADW